MARDLAIELFGVDLVAGMPFDHDGVQLRTSQRREQHQSGQAYPSFRQIVLQRRRSNHSPNFTTNNNKKSAGASHTGRRICSVIPAFE